MGSDEDVNHVRASIVVAGMFREGDPEAHDAAFFGNAIQQLHQHWIDPALAARSEATEAVRQALIVLHPDGPQVFINDEVEYTAVAGSNADFVKPQDCFVGHITSIWPDAVDPDLAWSGYTTAQHGRVLVFDLRRNRERVLELLARARDFVRSADMTLREGLLAPAVEHLNTAAELAVMVLIQLEGWNDRKQHHKRREWLRQACRYSDVPLDFAKAFDRLAAERNKARYAEGQQTLQAAEIVGLLAIVNRLIDFAKARRG